MAGDGTAARHGALAFTALVVLVVSALAGGYYVRPSVGSPARQSEDPAAGLVVVASAHSLDLAVSLNSTTIGVGQGVGVTVEERNTVDRVNYVASGQNWPVQGLATGPCASLDLPVGMAVYRGYYTASNISAAQGLVQYEPGTYACPMILMGIGAYAFQPSSHEAAVMGACDPNPCLTVEVHSTSGFDGYWNTTSQGEAFVGFPPGVYTVAAGDEWGALAFVHFSVLP